jgi:phosphoribosylglycinamide formyltransferase 1
MSAAPRAPLRIAILISGRGSNMLAIAHAAQRRDFPASIVAVLSDRADAAGLQRATELGLEARALTPAPNHSRAEYDAALAAALREYSPDLVVLAGFMRILGPVFVREFDGRMLNIHPALLPKHRGLHTHRRVLEARESEHGCSVHFVTEELDGGPVVLQARVPVLPGDTIEALSARVQAQEHRIYPMTIAWLATGRLEWRDGAPWLDGRPLQSPVVLDEPMAGA